MADVVEQLTGILYEVDEHKWIERRIACLRDGDLDRPVARTLLHI